MQKFSFFPFVRGMDSDLKKIIEQQREEIVKLKEELAVSQTRIADLTSALDKYQSVLVRQSHKLDFISDGLDGTVSKLEAMPPRKRGIGISAEPEDAESIVLTELKRHPKPNDVRKLLKQAILENDFLHNLAQDQLNSLIDCMYPIAHKAGEFLIREGEFGNILYVLFDGKLEIWKAEQKIREIGRCTVLGELAVLYNCERTATVKAATECQLWAIDRKSFQTILRKQNIERHKSRVAFLKSVPTFSSLPENVLSQLADQLTEIKYKPNEYVIRQGARGDNFYIVCSGSVNVTIHPTDENGQTDLNQQAKFARTLNRGDWFGEKALKGELTRSANIIAAEPNGATCLALDYESYHLLIGELNALYKRYSNAKLLEIGKPKDEAILKEFENLTFDNLIHVGTLGVGGFGRVSLVKIRTADERTFALKRMKKHHIVQTRQQEHVMNERNIMLEVNSDFIVKLWKTYRDSKYVYMLLEPCLGGELWTLLRDQNFFTESATQFYVACVIEALDYLHRRTIIFRDLKPENIMLDITGYCKLTDFGFSKKLPTATKTWTFCGTPEYMAPEIILNKGHDQAVDFWSLGILIYELLSGLPPFNSADAMRTYSLILKGIEAIGFPSHMSRNAQNLIRKLCRDNATERFGYAKGGVREIECHVWFEGFDWIGLQKRTLKPPHQRPIQSITDLSNFDKCPDEKQEPPDETSGWDEAF